MDESAINLFADRLSRIGYKSNTYINILFHGGEPLLCDMGFYKHTVDRLRRTLPQYSLSFCLQTNASLINNDWLSFFADNDISVSVSIDGPKIVQDENRRFANGSSSFDVVYRNICNALASHNANVIEGALALVYLNSDPIEVFEFLKQLGIPRLDFLWPDGTHVCPPPDLERNETNTRYSRWLCKIFDKWFSDGTGKPEIRMFNNILALMFGGDSSVEGIGPGRLGLLTIHTDGEIQDSDVLSIAYEHAGRFGDGFYLKSHSFQSLFRSRPFVDRSTLHGVAGLCQTCLDCYWRQICGGGLLPHRYDGNGFNAPSVYCDNIKFLLEHISNRVKQELSRADKESPREQEHDG
jgi:uncharacterized protein